MNRFYSLIDMNNGEGMQHYIFDRRTRKFWRSRWEYAYPEWLRDLPYRSSVNFLWPWWWFYTEINKPDRFR